MIDENGYFEFICPICKKLTQSDDGFVSCDHCGNTFCPECVLIIDDEGYDYAICRNCYDIEHQQNGKVDE